MNEDVLQIRVGFPVADSLAAAAETLAAIESGLSPAHHFGVGFADMGQMLAVFTPKRWELIARLREIGPVSVAELARQLGRDYKNVHGDVEKLAEWLAVERDESGKVFVPYAEIVLDMRLPDRAAA